ncbi:MAG: pitrilysin family protein [bacterium]
MGLRVFLALSMLLLSMGSCAWAGAASGPTVHFLPNGLTVVVDEDHSAPVAAIQYWVRAGSRTETHRQAGITHLIEHMIFKGTQKRKPGELAWEIESLGGTINAYTTPDYTVYHVSIASRFAWEGLELLTDAIQNASLDSSELEQEKRVVLEEIRMGEDRPQVKLQKALFAEAFKVHPYGRPVIGYPETVSSFMREDLLAYVEKLYVPANMTLILAGDLETGIALQWARKLWEGWDRPQAEAPQVKQEPQQETLRTVLLRKEVSEAHLRLAFPIPEASHPDVPALDVLAMILGDGESSRLEQRLRVQSGLVYTVGADSYTPLDPGLFIIHASLDPVNLNSAIRLVFEELEKVKAMGVSPSELEKARLQVEANLIHARETMSGRARVLGQFLMLQGDISKEKEYLEAVGKVGSEEIRRVALKYLCGKKLTAALLLPQESHKEMDQQALKELLEQASEQKIHRAQPETSPALSVHREVLPNGLTLLVRESHQVPTVAIRAVFLGGSRFETPQTAGLSKVVAHMLTRGTQSRSAQDLAQEVEAMAGSLEGFSGRNTFGVQADFLSRFFPQAMELLSDVIMNPTFPEQELERERPRLIASVRREKDQPTAQVMRIFAQTLFRVHPYGLRQHGTEESLGALKRDDLKAFASRWLVPNNGVISIAGDVSLHEARKWVQRFMGGWRSAEFVPPPVPQEPALEQVRQVRQEAPLQQVHVVLGFPGTTLQSPERFALEVLDNVLSGQGGRLFKELRDRQGLAYSVTSFSQVGLDPGYFGTYIATAPQNLERALEGLRKELQEVTRQEISPEELQRAKNNIVGTYEISQQTNAARAMSMALDERYGLGHDFGEKYPRLIQEVTAQQVLEAARNYLNLDRCVTVILGPGP